MKKLLLALALALFTSSALAQSAVVVSACGVPPSPYVAGTTRYPTIDTTGMLCDAGVVKSYSADQTPIASAATGTTGAVVATLAASASKSTYICSVDISATGGVASLGPITITGLQSAQTFTYQLFSTATGANLQKSWLPCLRSNAINTAIVVTTTADATASAVDVNISGFQQ